MRFLYFLSSFLVILSLFYFSVFPLELGGGSRSFLTAKVLNISSYVGDWEQSSFRAQEFISEDVEFEVFRAVKSEFTFCKGDFFWKGYIGKLLQDTVTARTYLSEGVQVEQIDPYACLKGESFLWDQNSLTLESLGGKSVSLNWTGGGLEGNSFLWEQKSGKMSLTGGIRGGFYGSS